MTLRSKDIIHRLPELRLYAQVHTPYHPHAQNDYTELNRKCVVDEIAHLFHGVYQSRIVSFSGGKNREAHLMGSDLNSRGKKYWDVTISERFPAMNRKK